MTLAPACPAQILVDTSAVYALMDRDDANHRAARAILTGLRTRRAEPFLTNFIVAESHALLLARLGADLARTWVLGNAWTVERVTEADEAAARQILARYTDTTFSYTDSTSFAVMQRRDVKTAFAFDPHFRQYGFEMLDRPRR